MKAFEIHTFKDGQWKIDSVFDDRELALHEARKVEEGGRYSSLRVIEEIYDEVSDLTTTRTLYRGGSAKKNAIKRRDKPSRSTRTPSRGSGAEEPLRKNRGAHRQTKQSNLLVPILILIIVIMAGVAGLLAMQTLGMQK